jgi:hypothetical protein
MGDCRSGDHLAHLRRQLAWQGHDVSKPKTLPIRIDATALEKRKAQPHLHDEQALYKMGWFLHMGFVAPIVATSQDKLLVVAASIGTKKTRELFGNRSRTWCGKCRLPATESLSGGPIAIRASRWPTTAAGPYNGLGRSRTAHTSNSWGARWPLIRTFSNSALSTSIRARTTDGPQPAIRRSGRPQGVLSPKGDRSRATDDSSIVGRFQGKLEHTFPRRERVEKHRRLLDRG